MEMLGQNLSSAWGTDDVKFSLGTRQFLRSLSFSLLFEQSIIIRGWRGNPREITKSDPFIKRENCSREICLFEGHYCGNKGLCCPSGYASAMLLKIELCAPPPPGTYKAY